MKTTLLLLSFFLIQNCHKTEFSEQPPFELESVSSQKWTGGQQQTGAGTHLEIQIKKELPKNCTLQRVYFQNQQAKIEKQNSTQFIARFYQKP